MVTSKKERLRELVLKVICVSLYSIYCTFTRAGFRAGEDYRLILTYNHL